MSLLAPAQGLRRWPSLTSFFQRGTAPNEIWYGLGCQNQTAFSTSATSVATGRIRAISFVVSRTVVVDGIAFEVTTGGAAGSVCRAGIYRAISPTNMYAGQLLVDGGEKDTTAIAVHQTLGLSVSLSPGQYWAVVICGVAAPTVRIPQLAGLQSTMGALTTLAGNNFRLDAAQAYGALPSTFPSGGNISNFSGGPLVAARFSG